MIWFLSDFTFILPPEILFLSSDSLFPSILLKYAEMCLKATEMSPSRRPLDAADTPRGLSSQHK